MEQKKSRIEAQCAKFISLWYISPMNEMENMSNADPTGGSPGINTEENTLTNIDTDLDLKGLMCPMPLLKAKKALNELQPLQILRVQATDPGSVRDFSVFASQSGHILLSSTEEDGTFVYLIQKKV